MPIAALDISDLPNAARISVAIISHVLTDGVLAVFERMQREAPPDHDVRLILSVAREDEHYPGDDAPAVIRISREAFLRRQYPEKCHRQGWSMTGNLDLVFMEFADRVAGYDTYWFVEYDVHWEGYWSVFFEHFRPSGAAVIATTVMHIDDIPHKEFREHPPLVTPSAVRWDRRNFIKCFLPICRIDRAVFTALDAAYRAGLGGHYELTVASVAAANGLEVEDIGGAGAYVRAENVNRFYFANGSTYTHSPGNFVFRPDQRVLPRLNTLWHPVKLSGVPLWHPLRKDGGFLKRLVEKIKPVICRVIIWVWFATRWRPFHPPEIERRVRS